METRPRATSAKRLTQLHDLMLGHVEDGHAPGLVSVVCHRGESHIDVIGTTAVD